MIFYFWYNFTVTSMEFYRAVRKCPKSTYEVYNLNRFKLPLRQFKMTSALKAYTRPIQDEISTKLKELKAVKIVDEKDKNLCYLYIF